MVNAITDFLVSHKKAMAYLHPRIWCSTKYKIHVVHWFGTIFSALSDRALKRCCHKVSTHPSLSSLPCSYSLYPSICCVPPFEHRTTQAAVRLQSTALKPPPRDAAASFVLSLFNLSLLLRPSAPCGPVVGAGGVSQGCGQAGSGDDVPRAHRGGPPRAWTGEHSERLTEPPREGGGAGGKKGRKAGKRRGSAQRVMHNQDTFFTDT